MSLIGKRNVFMSFEAQNGDNIEVLEMKGGDFMRKDVMKSQFPEILNEFGETIFWYKLLVIVNGKQDFDDYINMSPFDFNMCAECILEQMSK